jgi:putative oxidoreductase
MTTPAESPISRVNARIAALVPESAIALLMRIGIAVPFFLSGRTKVEGLLTLKDSTFFLFAEEYRVPLLPPDLAAYAATWAEQALPILIILGLLTRPAALGLLVMTAVIQLFVVPGGWPTHLLWLAPLVYLIARGPGGWSMDRLLRLD